MEDLLDYNYYQDVATSCYGDMLHDNERNQKFSLSIKKAIKKIHSEGRKAHVLDIGTGTGLLAMLSVQHGADSVVACEMFPPVAKCASKIIAENGFSTKIKLIEKHSTALTVGENCDLPRKANILVSEVFDTELIGEGAIQTFNHAHAFLLEENCIVIPSAAIIYGLVVESNSLLRWNKLENWKDGNNELVTIPPCVVNCPGAPALFDIQMSQLPRNDFTCLTEPLPLFKFNFVESKAIPTHESQKIKVIALLSGKAQAIFIWWDLMMDDEQEVVLSCSPVWYHPQAPKKLPTGNPALGIPWRDHWMQAVYFLPLETDILGGEPFTLKCSHDEFSLWFEICKCKTTQDCLCVVQGPPACHCGLHLLASRTRIAALNDSTRRYTYLATARDLIQRCQYFIIIGDFTLIGFLLQKLGAKKVYILAKDTLALAVKVYNDFITVNNTIISIHNDYLSIVEDFKQISSNCEEAQLCIFGEPFFQTSLLPWENAQFFTIKEEILKVLSDFIKPDKVVICPLKLKIKACCVQFDDLWKISRPLNTCMGFKLKMFDELIMEAKKIAQVSPEPQPLWEYPCIARSKPVTLCTLDFAQVGTTTTPHKSLAKFTSGKGVRIDGVVVWAEYDMGSGFVKTGPAGAVQEDEYIIWDRCERQGVHLYSLPLEGGKDITCSLEFNPKTSQFHFNFSNI